MADNDDLMIEVTGSSDKAASAIDKIIAKVTQMQEAIDKVTPSLSKFAERLDSITSGSKAFAMLDKLTKSTGDLSQASKKAEADEAMYQARIDRATVSMERSRIASEKLAAARQKAQEYAAIDAHNQAAFSMSPEEFRRNFDHSGAETPTETVAPEVPEVSAPIAPSMKYNAASIQAQMDAFTAKIGGKTPKINVDTEAATAEVRKIGEYIDSLTPKLSSMSSTAREKFDSLANALRSVSQQLDNQRSIYSRLGAESAKVAEKQGEGSLAYLRMEKQMLSASNAIDRLNAKESKLKSQLDDVTSSSKKVSSAMEDMGNKAESSGKKSSSVWDNTLRMMEKMFVRIAAFRIFSAISQGIVTGIQDMALAGGQANEAMSALATNSLYLKNSIGAALMPALQALVPVLNQVSDAIAGVFNDMAMLTARIFNHSETAVIATRANVNYAETLNKAGDSASNANKKIKELQNSVMGFDELNKLTEPTADTSDSSKNKNPGMPAYGDMFKTVKIPQWVDNIGGVTDQIGKVISGWWNGLTSAQKWGVGIGGTAGFVIGGIIGRLIGGPIGQRVGEALGTVAGAAIGKWWQSLTSKEKWAAGRGATAGVVIGGIIGGLIGGPMGIKIGSVLGGVAGTVIGKWWEDLTDKKKWSVGIGASIGTILGGIIGGIIGGPVGVGIGILLGGSIGAALGAAKDNIVKWWNGLVDWYIETVQKQWNQAGEDLAKFFGIDKFNSFGQNIMNGLINGISYIMQPWKFGAWLATEIIENFKSLLGIHSPSTVFSGFGGNIIQGLVNGIKGSFGKVRDAVGSLIDNLTAPFKNIQWPQISLPRIKMPHFSISYSSAGWASDALSWLGLPGVPSLSVKWYANGGVFNKPTLVSGLGEAGPEAALPLNDKVFSQIAQGIVRNGGNSSSDADMRNQISEISKQIAALKEAILSRPVKLYTDDRTIAESAERGKTQIARQYHLAT